MSKNIKISLMEVNNRLNDAAALLDRQINSSVDVMLAHTTCAYSKLLSDDTKNSHYDSLSKSKRELSYLRSRRVAVKFLLFSFRLFASITTNFSKVSNLLWRIVS